MLHCSKSSLRTVGWGGGGVGYGDYRLRLEGAFRLEQDVVYVQKGSKNQGENNYSVQPKQIQGPLNPVIFHVYVYIGKSLFIPN